VQEPLKRFHFADSGDHGGEPTMKSRC
jgi:hypothetical protein